MPETLMSLLTLDVQQVWISQPRAGDIVEAANGEYYLDNIKRQLLSM